MTQVFVLQHKRAIATVLLLTFCLGARAQGRLHHGTAVVAIRHGNGLVIAADSLEVGPARTDISACKIFTAAHTVFSLAGIGGIGATKFSDAFLHNTTFTRAYDEATFRKAGDSWASGVLDVLNNHFWSFPQDYWALKKNDRSTIAIFAGVTSSGQLLLVQERVHYDPARTKKFPYLVADSRTITIDETLVMGGGSLDTYAEMLAGTSQRARASKPLMLALDGPPSLSAALETARSFIATTEAWHPEESGGEIAELAFSPTGIVWTNRSSACR